MALQLVLSCQMGLKSLLILSWLMQTQHFSIRVVIRTVIDSNDLYLFFWILNLCEAKQRLADVVFLVLCRNDERDGGLVAQINLEGFVEVGEQEARERTVQRAQRKQQNGEGVGAEARDNRRQTLVGEANAILQAR